MVKGSWPHFQTLQVEEIPDQFVQPLCLAVNGAQIGLLFLGRNLVVQHELRVAEHGGEGGAHFMADGGHHFLFDPFDLLPFADIEGDLHPHQSAVGPADRPVYALKPPAGQRVLKLPHVGRVGLAGSGQPLDGTEGTRVGLSWLENFITMLPLPVGAEDGGAELVQVEEFVIVDICYINDCIDRVEYGRQLPELGVQRIFRLFQLAHHPRIFQRHGSGVGETPEQAILPAQQYYHVAPDHPEQQ